MADEKKIWTGQPSQVENMGSFIFLGLLFWLVVPLFIILWQWLVTKNTKYELSTERLKTMDGVLNKEINELELYRVRDYKVESPLFLRMFSLGNVVLDTSDRSHAQIVIKAIPNATRVCAELRKHVEECRLKKGVREIDIQ